MAVVREMNLEAFEEWVRSRPEHVQAMIRSKPPDRLYRIRGGCRATIYSYEEDSTVTVEVTGQFNRVLFGRRVFGIPIDELEECDLPGPDEDVGDTAAKAGYTEQEIREILIPKLREAREADGLEESLSE